MAEEEQSNNDGERGLGEPDLPIEFEIIPETPSSSSGKHKFSYQEPLGIGDLEEETLKRLDRDRETLQRELNERDQLHVLRTSHTRKLFRLTVIWVVVIWVILLLQGFEQWFFPWPAPSFDEKYLKFKLSDSVIIAFMTSTTATVLGLYGIAAYWLYGKPKTEDKVVSKDEKK